MMNANTMKTGGSVAAAMSVRGVKPLPQISFTEWVEYREMIKAKIAADFTAIYNTEYKQKIQDMFPDVEMVFTTRENTLFPTEEIHIMEKNIKIHIFVSSIGVVNKTSNEYGYGENSFDIQFHDKTVINTHGFYDECECNYLKQKYEKMWLGTLPEDFEKFKKIYFFGDYFYGNTDGIEIEIGVIVEPTNFDEYNIDKYNIDEDEDDYYEGLDFLETYDKFPINKRIDDLKQKITHLTELDNDGYYDFFRRFNYTSMILFSYSRIQEDCVIEIIQNLIDVEPVMPGGLKRAATAATTEEQV